MATYTIDEVKIDGAYPIDKILELSMCIEVNQHGLLTYGGLVSEETAKKAIQQSADMQCVKVYWRDEIEFCGYPHEIVTKHYNDHCFLQVTLASSSVLMDSLEHSRFFQDEKQTCVDILTDAYKDSQIGSLTSTTTKDRILDPMLQYRETDWQFTLRMASNIDELVIPNVTSQDPQILLGIPNRKAIHEDNNIHYSINRSSDIFRQKYTANSKLSFQNFLCYNMTSSGRYRLGDSVDIGDQIYTVMKKNTDYKQGVISEVYLLGHEQAFSVSLHHNKCISGLELMGSVLERKGQNLLLLLDIDSNRKECEKTWFSYSPTTNNGMYSMPLENEKVMLQWQSNEDNDVLVVRPDRKNGAAMQPPERHFLSEHENHLAMVSGKVEYANPVGSVKWLASNGFDISTAKSVKIDAGWDVSITSQAKIDISSPERITVCKADVESSIDMIGSDLHIKAAKKVTAKSKANQYKKATLPDRSQTFKINTATASKLAAAVPQVMNAQN